MSPITESEITNTINNLPNNKAPGPSNITYNIIKQIQSEILPFLKHTFNKIIEEEEIPTDWRKYNIYPISKKIE